MKILQITPYPPQENGIAVYSEKLVEGLEEVENIEVVVVGPSKGTDHFLDLKEIFSFRKNLKEIIEKENPDVVHYQHTFEVFGILGGIQIPYFDGVENVLTLHEPDIEMPYNWYSITTRLSAIAQSRLVKNMDKIIVHLEKNKKELEENYGVSNISVIRHGVDNREIKSRDKEIEEVLCFGLISQNKDMSLMSELARENPDVKVKIAGKVSNGSTEDLDTDLENLKHVNRWIDEEEKDELFWNADVIALPYRFQKSASGVLAEAAAYETPVLATDIDAFRESVENFQMGETREPGKFSTGVASIQDKYSDYQDKMKAYKKQFGWSQVAQNYLKIYR